MDQRLSAADAAVVCDATLLSLLDGWATAEYGSDNVLAMPILAAAAQGRAAVECARTARLNERRAAVATSVNDLVLREAASPAEGHSGVLAEASAADRSPVISTSEKSLNGPAEPDTTSAEPLLSAAD